MFKDLEELFQEIGFSYYASYDELKYDRRFDKHYIANRIYLNGRKNLAGWIGLIGFSNPKFTNKIEVWQKTGIFPPEEMRASGETFRKI